MLTCYTAQKMESSTKDSATEEILNIKLHFLCSAVLTLPRIDRRDSVVKVSVLLLVTSGTRLRLRDFTKTIKVKKINRRCRIA